MFDARAAVEWGHKVAGLNAGAASDTDLCEAAVALAQVQSLIAAGQAHVLAELDRRGVCDHEFGMTTASWLAREGSLPGAVTRRHVKVATKLRTLPTVEDALADGRVSIHHANVLADACTPRVATAVAALQDELLALASGATFEQWRSDVRGLIELLDEDGGHDPNDDLARNQLTIAETIDGVSHLAGQLVGDAGLVVRQAVDAKADELFRQFTADAAVCPDLVVPARTTLRALALAELCRSASAVAIESSRPPRPEVTLVVQADAPSAATTDAGGVHLQDGTTRTLLCDPDVFALVVDSLGVPLDLGRHVRLATAAQRRALAARDGGCVFPGCTLPSNWCDAHHIEPFNLGGRTDVAQLASLCRRHHGVTHRRGWQMSVTDDGWFWWQSPTGLTFWSQRHGRRRAGPAPPARE